VPCRVAGTAANRADGGAGRRAALRRGRPDHPVRLLLAGGITNIVDLAQSLEFYPGLHLGLAVLVPAETRPAVRVDLSRRVYLSSGETYPLWSIGLGLPVSARR
jgi:hypothetical protein